MRAGIDKVADAVMVTMGPRGRNVVLDQTYGVPQVINDGVSIARAIELEDPAENAGAQLLKEVAGKTNDAAGDGTTTATVLAREMIALGLRQVEAGANPVAVKRGIDRAAAAAVAALSRLSRPVNGDADVRAVATVSAGNDAEVGAMIADAIARVGSDGVLSVESGRGLETTVEVAEGMGIERGFASPQFVTDPERQLAILDRPLVLLTDAKLEQAADLVPALEACSRASRPLLIVADDVAGEALATLVVNKLRGVVQVLAIKAPGFGDRRKAMLRDIAALTGATVITGELGRRVADVAPEDLGEARRVETSATATTLLGEHRFKDAVEERVKVIRRELQEATSDYDAEKLQERLAKLHGGVAVVKVGAATEAELEDRKLRIEDAKNATFAAIEEGIVPGGGAALLALTPAVAELQGKLLAGPEVADPDELAGVEVVRRALAAPTRIIANNAGVEGEVIVRELDGKPFGVGYDAAKGVVRDLFEAGIVDPAKVTRSALANAASIAGVMLTTQALMFVKPKKNAQANQGLGAGMPQF